MPSSACSWETTISTGTAAPNATPVVYDFLAILQADFAAGGTPYTAESTSTNADLEAPRVNPAFSNGFTDVRLTDRNAILVRAPLVSKFTHPADGHYTAQLIVPTLGGPVTLTRGWTSIDYQRSARTTVRIFTTHLEVGTPCLPRRCRLPRAHRHWGSSTPARSRSSRSVTSTRRATGRPPQPVHA